MSIVWRTFKLELLYYLFLLLVVDSLEVLSLIFMKYIVEWIKGCRDAATGIIFIAAFILLTFFLALFSETICLCMHMKCS